MARFASSLNDSTHLPAGSRGILRHPTSSSTRFYRPELDALRFFACLATFAFHWMDYVPFDAKLHHTLFASPGRGERIASLNSELKICWICDDDPRPPTHDRITYLNPPTH